MPVTSEKAGEHQVLHSSSSLGQSDISKVLLGVDQEVPALEHSKNKELCSPFPKIIRSGFLGIHSKHRNQESGSGTYQI